MDDSNRGVATLTVTVDDATLSLTATDSNPAGTELVGPEVTGDLRLRVDTDRRSDDAEPPDAERTTTHERSAAADGTSSTPEVDDSTTDDPTTESSVTDDPLGDDSSPEAASRARFEVYEDRAGEFRWRLVHDNGNVIADSGEGYATWRGAENGIRSVKTNASGAPVERL